MSMIDNSVPHRLRRSLIRTAVAVAVLAICVCFFACTQTDQQPAGPAEEVTIAFATPPFTVLADIAQAQGYFRMEGLETTTRFHSTGRAALEDVLKGKADVATVAETPVMFAIMNGEKISIIANIQTSNKVNAIFARKDRGILAPHDLKGKRIAASLGTIGEFFLDSFLATRGIARKDVTVVDLKPEETPEALEKGRVDAASVWQPLLSQAQKKLGDKGITFYDEDIYKQTFNIAATQEFIRKNPEKVKKMLRALIKAEEFVIQNPEKAQINVADFRQMDKALLAEVWVGNTFGVKLSQSLVLALEDESQWAIKNGLTNAMKVPNYLDFIYLDGLASVKPEAVRILR